MEQSIETQAINRLACIYEMLDDGTTDADIMAWVREQRKAAHKLLYAHGVWKDEIH